MRKKIIVLDDYENSYEKLSNWSNIKALADVEIFNEPIYGDKLLETLKKANALVLMRDRTPLPASLIAQLSHLEYVVFTGTRNLALDAGWSCN